jgi:nucleoside-diphosphate-sugar epimerase
MQIRITDSAGFIGCNLAAASVRAGHWVTLDGNLARWGSEANLGWPRATLDDERALASPRGASVITRLCLRRLSARRQSIIWRLRRP